MSGKQFTLTEALRDPGLVVIDVRSSDEFSSGGTCPGAINVPVADVGQRMDEWAKESPVLLYCAVGARSARAAKQLRDNGFTNVFNVSNGDKAKSLIDSARKRSH